LTWNDHLLISGFHPRSNRDLRIGAAMFSTYSADRNVRALGNSALWYAAKSRIGAVLSAKSIWRIDI
jgi:hypothetical protein